MSQLFPAPKHDHAECIDDALRRAEACCRERGVRLTPRRRQVLRLVWSNHRPVGAYELLERMARSGDGAAPMTVYRALEFLQAQGLVHRIDSLNAYIGCPQPEDDHVPQFLICRQCEAVAEICDERVERVLNQVSDHRGFKLEQQRLELEGLCQHCLGRGME